MTIQRNANYWRIAEIPLLILTLVNFFIIFYTNDWLIAGLSIIVSIVGSFIVLFLIYNHYISRQNERDEEVMRSNSRLISIQNLRDQVDIIDKYIISNMDNVRSAKIQNLESQIDNRLTNIFRGFRDQSNEYIIEFLASSMFTPSILRERWIRLREFMEKVYFGSKVNSLTSLKLKRMEIILLKKCKDLFCRWVPMVIIRQLTRQ